MEKCNFSLIFAYDHNMFDFSVITAAQQINVIATNLFTSESKLINGYHVSKEVVHWWHHVDTCQTV